MSPPQHVLLSSVEHHDLRIVTTRGALWGDAVMAAPTFAAEFRQVQAHYPIVFQKTAEGFQPLALFGFEPGQNLFLVDEGAGDRWDAAYVPMAIERGPFLVGFDRGEPVIHLDAASPRLSREHGEPLFLPHGGSSELLERISGLLGALHEGLQATPAFVAALQAHQLLEPFAMDLELADGSLHRWSGYYTVHEERLAALRGDAVAALHAQGHLFAAHLQLDSLVHLHGLAERASRRALAAR